MTNRTSRTIDPSGGGLRAAPSAYGAAGQPRRPRSGMAILLVIVAVAAAAVIGSAYVANRLNAPQVVRNVNGGAQARYLADSGADLATAIMECETFDWRLVQTNGVLVSNLPLAGGTVTIRVSDVSGAVPDSSCEYPVVTASGSSGSMKQAVAAQVHAPLPERVKEEVTVDLSEFAVFGAASIEVTGGWIARWEASPRGALGLPVNLGTNGLVDGALRLRATARCPDGVGFTMAAATANVLADDQSGGPIPRVNFSNNEAALLPAPPTPSLGGLTWAAARNPTITTSTSIVSTGDKRYGSLTIDGGTLRVDLGGAHRTMGITGNLALNNGGVLSLENGQLDLVIQGALNMFNASTIELGAGATLRIFLGGTMSIDDSVVGLPVSVTQSTRDARSGLSTYFDPQRCTIYRITSINSVDLNLLDLDDAAAWIWSDATSKSWMINNKSYICARVYGHSKADISLNSRAAVFGNVVGRTISMSTEGAVYYDHVLDRGNGYTSPQSRLYAGPLDLRDDIRLLLTDLNPGTIASILSLLNGGAEPIIIDPFGVTPRDKTRVRSRSWRHYGLKVWRERELGADDTLTADVD